MHAQVQTERFYAKMALHDAEELKADFPSQVTIIATNGNEAAVYMTEFAGHELHDRVLVHGPGYIFKASEAAVLESLNKSQSPTRSVIDFTITEDVLVNQAIAEINTSNIESHIMELEAYGTRHHATSSGMQASVDLKARWEAMAASYNRTDVSVRLFNHVNTNMPSVIMTIQGAEFPEEFVIVGGHLDSTSSQAQTNAPGADDDASGIATITEATRSLFEIGFVPKRTIEIMAYSAEEIGLVGSAEIAEEYADNDIDVGAVVQFDMTNFNGSANDISFVTDFTNATLNNYLMSLLDHYNGSGANEITYGTSLCNYGCSDHASWTAEGYMASFPFEANFGAHNPAIHTPNDTYAAIGTATHATKFAKLCVEFLIEASKSEGALGLDDVTINAVNVFTSNGVINYNITATNQDFTVINLYDISGKLVTTQEIKSAQGTINTSNFTSGLYIANFVTDGKGAVSKKVIIK
ncbi:aminopeptidase [Patiriisocius marinistellae]|uniref:Aminopeptidase n=2 Tax=Patiriisocius marinistellae TaxID=2494560 RepID=A0A5J4FT62_9FLAO|nr:aminopeptidase [Patiriisocius marinistellae]